MKTCFCWDTVGEEQPQFFELEGDYTHLNDVYINNTASAENLKDELNKLVYDQETGDYIVDMQSQPSKDWDVFITCGFMP